MLNWLLKTLFLNTFLMFSLIFIHSDLVYAKSKENLDCLVSTWSAWSKCSKPCQSGKQYRTRKIVRLPKNNGAQCPKLISSRICNDVHCTNKGKLCKAGKWGKWSKCSKKCGKGFQYRFRKIVGFPKMSGNGNDDCPKLIEKRSCNNIDCNNAGKICLMSKWSKWSKCSKKCGGGVQYRTRDVIQFPEREGNADDQCASLSNSRSCNKRPCQEKSRTSRRRNKSRQRSRR